jgi:hypothetical protein
LFLSGREVVSPLYFWASLRHAGFPGCVVIEKNAVFPAEAGICNHYYRRELVSGFRRKDKPKPKNGIATQSVSPE